MFIDSVSIWTNQYKQYYAQKWLLLKMSVLIKDGILNIGWGGGVGSESVNNMFVQIKKDFNWICNSDILVNVLTIGAYFILVEVLVYFYLTNE